MPSITESKSAASTNDLGIEMSSGNQPIRPQPRGAADDRGCDSEGKGVLAQCGFVGGLVAGIVIGFEVSSSSAIITGISICGGVLGALACVCCGVALVSRANRVAPLAEEVRVA